METITLKINTRTKKGKAFMEFLKQFLKDDKTVDSIKTPNEATIKAINEVKKGNSSKISLSDFRKQLYS